MSEQTLPEQTHGHATGEHAHPGPAQYILIGLILFFLTVIEVAIVYIQPITTNMPVLITSLMVLMTIKFILVAMFFMHLKFDNRLFSTLFTAPLLIAICITLAMVALFGAFTAGQHGGHYVPGLSEPAVVKPAEKGGGH
jgi:cytochrome c oxidase subunit IV